VMVVYYAEQWRLASGEVGLNALHIASAKVSLSFSACFCRAILCNALVCLAVWLCFSARNTVGKILAIIFPITAFVAGGFEHCVANMYFVPMGILLKNTPTLVSTLGEVSSRLTWRGFLQYNLLPATLGNIVGGAGFVAITYWFVYISGRRGHPG